jgi:GT2 family glycosyltransferase
MVKVSVVIPTYNRLDRLERVLIALTQQTYPLDAFEVVVVSDGSEDGTNVFLQTYQTPFHLTSILQTNQGVATARNNGVEHATGKIIVFLDDDVIPTPDLVLEHIGLHETSGNNLVVLGPMLSPPDFEMKPWVRWEQSMLMKQYDEMTLGFWEPTARQFYTGNTSLSRSHILEAGGFDPAFRRAEDVELAYRLAEKGVRFVFNSKAVGYHYAERSFMAWMDIAYTYGMNDVIFTKQKGQEWLLPTIWREYHSRNWLIKFIVNLSLDRFLIQKFLLAVMKQGVLLGSKANADRLVHMACSGIFNVRHYQGISDQLGGRTAFYKGVAHMKPSTSNSVANISVN